MKNIALALLLLGVFASGCTTTEPDLGPVVLNLSETLLDLKSGGTRVAITVESNYGFTIRLNEGDGEWLSLVEHDSGRNETEVTVTVQPNYTASFRTASVSFTSRDQERVLTVSQGVSTLELSAPALAFDYAGGTDHITVASSISDWSVEVLSGGEWCKAVRTGDGAITVRTTPNTSSEVREATVRVSVGEIDRTFAVTQDILVFEVSHPALDFEYIEATKSLTVSTNAAGGSIGISCEQAWCKAVKEGENGVAITVEINSGAARSGVVLVTIGHITRQIAVNQAGVPPRSDYADMEVVRLQEATVGSGVNIVIMGDGYIASQMNPGGKYESEMRAAMEHFFSTYPYDRYRDYFNVWMVGAVSNEEGASTSTPSAIVDTKFETLITGGGSTRVSCNNNTVRTYTRLVADEIGVPLSRMTVILPINKYIYAGTCWMWTDGYSISLCPVGPSYKNIVVHEASGHGFGKLSDEYRRYNTTIPDSDKENVLYWKKFGFYANIDFYPDILETCWAGFAGNPKYPMVSTFEGAHYYDFGVWRPEYNSCMNNNVLYFNAPSRYIQVQRMHDWAGIEYSFDRFLEEDIVPSYPSSAREAGSGVLKPFVPLAPPVITTTSPDNQTTYLDYEKNSVCNAGRIGTGLHHNRTGPQSRSGRAEHLPDVA